MSTLYLHAPFDFLGIRRSASVVKVIAQESVQRGSPDAKRLRREGDVAFALINDL
jgi:hypothetical protein